jgi:hypothetical protein
MADEIDVLVAYVVPEDVWYVFPVGELARMRSMKLFPGTRRKRSKFEKYREAWWILQEDGRGKCYNISLNDSQGMMSALRG